MIKTLVIWGMKTTTSEECSFGPVLMLLKQEEKDIKEKKLQRYYFPRPEKYDCQTAEKPNLTNLRKENGL